MFQKEFHIDKRVLYQLVECEDNPYYTPLIPLTHNAKLQTILCHPSQQYYKFVYESICQKILRRCSSSEPISNPQR